MRIVLSQSLHIFCKIKEESAAGGKIAVRQSKTLELLLVRSVRSGHDFIDYLVNGNKVDQASRFPIQ